MEKENKLFYILLSLVIFAFLIILIPFLVLTFYPSDTPNQPESQDNNNIIHNRTLQSIYVDRYPFKMKYKEGEIFDPTGLILRGLYDDETSSQIFNYKIEKTEPLTIYNRYIEFFYKEFYTCIEIEIINNNNMKIIDNLSYDKYTIDPSKYFITRFEIEDADVSKWVISDNDSDNLNKVISRNDSSRKKFLSGLEKGIINNSQLYFNINLYFDAEIELTVSYAQKEEFKNYEYDMSLIYVIIINENKTIEIEEKDKILYPRSDITNWQLIKYKSFILPKGTHNITLKVLPDHGNKGTPNIDYIDFKTSEIYEVSEDIIPNNDFHTLLQYLYLNDSNPTNIHKYAKGNYDLSKPRGNILDFSDSIKTYSESYIIEISDNINFKNSKKVFNLKEKKYILKNLKLLQKIYYRGAITENELKFAKIYEFIVDNKGPRNLYVPGVVNFRDIGGYKTTLVKNGIIKQGLFYRSGQLNDITNEGKEILTKDLGIKIEIDLKEKYYNTGPYIDGIKYNPIPIDPYIEYRGFDQLKDEFYKIFTLISQADINPIVLHCYAGADRTGIMSFALLTLLGCDYDDIVRDYLFTNFSNDGVRDVSYEFTNWWEKLNAYKGITKDEQCKNWLMSKGLEESKLEHIRDIFIDGYKEI